MKCLFLGRMWDSSYTPGVCNFLTRHERLFFGYFAVKAGLFARVLQNCFSVILERHP